MTDENQTMTPHDDERGHAIRRHRSEHSTFVPLALLAVAVVVWAGFQTLQLWRESDALAASRFNQERPLENSKKMREGLDKIAKETQLLANKGNASARLIVDELRKRGVTINPDAPPAPAADKK
jgi:hypothetical protein